MILFCIFTCCYSVFSGGASGRVVDAESTSTPKTGIADVEVYAYVDSSTRDSDFKKWDGLGRFLPSSDYYFHTTTGQNGNFSISKVLWKSYNSKFGKDADYSVVYLLFYHEYYGLVKGSTLIVSDSTSDTVYQEMTKTKKTTVLNMNFIDVANNTTAAVPVQVKIMVPQTTEANPNAAPQIYNASITGTGAISVAYPRYLNDTDKAAGKENNPQIKIYYEQNSDETTWKACYNGNSPSLDYSFLSIPEVNKNIYGDNFAISLYGKRTKLFVPVVSGKCGDDNGVLVSMKAELDDGTSFDCGSVTTAPKTYGNNTINNGEFSGLGSGYYWTDTTYTSKDVSVTLKLSGNSKSAVQKVDSSKENLYIVLN